MSRFTALMALMTANSSFALIWLGIDGHDAYMSALGGVLFGASVIAGLFVL